MSDYSLTVFLNPGIIAAFVFFIFEIVIFPLTFFATSRVAALTLQRNAENGKCIRIRSIIFPLWSKGLLNGEKAHWVLLIIRMIIIALPVYLETRLERKEIPKFQTTVLPHTFEVNPITNWVSYGHETNDSIIALRENGQQASTVCTTFDGYGWVVALVANVTYHENGDFEKISCVNGTKKRVFKPVRAVPDYAQISNSSLSRPEIIGNYTLNINISYGTVDSFPSSPETERLPLADALYRIENITITSKEKNVRGLHCFFPNHLQQLVNLSSTFFDILCQNDTGKIVDYLNPDIKRTPVNFAKQSEPNHFENRSIQHASAQINVGVLYIVGRLEFPGTPVFTAEHLNNVDFVQPPLKTIDDFNLVVDRILYTKHDNRTTQIRLDSTEEVTVLDSVFLFTLLAEIVFVIIAAAAMLLVGTLYIRLNGIPTTVNGLSKCWAHYDSYDAPKSQSYVHLRMKNHLHHGPKYLLEYCAGDEVGDILSHVGTGKAARQ